MFVTNANSRKPKLISPRSETHMVARWWMVVEAKELGFKHGNLCDRHDCSDCLGLVCQRGVGDEG